MDTSRTEHTSTPVEDDGVAERTPTPGNEEFPELKKPKFGWARFQLAGFALASALIVVLGVVIALADEPVVGVVLAGVGLLALLGSWAWHRKMKQIERDPSARNPQDNPVNRSLLRLRRDHPVAYALLAVLMAGLFVYTVYLRWTS